MDIFKTSVVPIISITDIAQRIPNNILKISPIWSNKLIMLLSATGSAKTESSLYAIVSIDNFIMGRIQIPIIIIIPTNPNCIF